MVSLRPRDRASSVGSSRAKSVRRDHMTARETAWQAAETAAAVLGPEADVLASADSAGLGQATMAMLGRAARQPGAMTAATLRFWTSAVMAGPVATARWLGLDAA